MEQAFIGADFTQVGTKMISTVQPMDLKYLEICTLRLENLLLPLFLVQISVKPTFALSLSLSLSLSLPPSMFIALISTLIPRDIVDITMLQCILKLSSASTFSK